MSAQEVAQEELSSAKEQIMKAAISDDLQRLETLVMQHRELFSANQYAEIMQSIDMARRYGLTDPQGAAAMGDLQAILSKSL